MLAKNAVYNNLLNNCHNALLYLYISLHGLKTSTILNAFPHQVNFTAGMVKCLSLVIIYIGALNINKFHLYYLFFSNCNKNIFSLKIISK